MRIHKLCHLSGPKDPTRFTTWNITTQEVSQQVRGITDSKLPGDWKWGKKPLRRKTPAPEEVGFFILFSGIPCIGLPDIAILFSCFS